MPGRRTAAPRKATRLKNRDNRNGIPPSQECALWSDWTPRSLAEVSLLRNERFDKLIPAWPTSASR